MQSVSASPSTNHWLIMTALDPEFRIARHSLRQAVAKPGLPYRSATGWFAEKTAVAVQTGVGPERAQQATRWAIEQFAPQQVLSIGFAGALLPSLRSGQLVVANYLIDASEEDSIHASDEREKLASTALQTAPTGDSIYGSIVSVDRLVATPHDKSRLYHRTKAVAVDMESFGIGRACAIYETPFTVLRAIVDDSSTSVPETLLSFVRPDGFLAPGHIAAGLIRHPTLVRNATVLWRASRSAGTTLLRALESIQQTSAVEVDRRDRHD